MIPDQIGITVDDHFLAIETGTEIDAVIETPEELLVTIVRTKVRMMMMTM